MQDDEEIVLEAHEGTAFTTSANEHEVVATAVVAEPVPSHETTHALTGSNRFIPVATASALPDYSGSSSHDEDDDWTESRPDLLSATVYKSFRDTPIGIALMETANVGVTVKRIVPDGLFGESSFQIGDRFLSVNSESCEGLDSKSVADLIRKAQRIVTVVVRAPNGRADRVSSMVMKESPDARLGIGFRNRHGKVVISRIAEDGIFAHSLLNVSDTCLSINGEPCTSSTTSTSAVEVIRAAPSFVTIVAKTRHETGVVVATSAEAAPEDAFTTTIGAASPPTAVASGAASPARIPVESAIASAQKKGCICVVVVIIILVVIVAFAVSGSGNDEYNSPCNVYTRCEVCGRNCYNYTTRKYEYCCEDEYFYTCSGTCPCFESNCTLCDQLLNETTFEYEYDCAVELTSICYGSYCPCTYKLCGNDCGNNCWNETTLVYDYCCKPNYEFTCDESCPYGSPPFALAASPTSSSASPSIGSPSPTDAGASSPSPSGVAP